MILSVVIVFSVHSANICGNTRSEDDYLTAGTQFIQVLLRCGYTEEELFSPVLDFGAQCNERSHEG